MSTNKTLTIKSKFRGGAQINLTGGQLDTKFSIVENPTSCRATAKDSNKPLTDLLDGLLGSERYESTGYWWWDVPRNQVISTITAVIDEFGE
jgi:hypothetical protein